jgi:aryl-alcohol dehydrogenase-like predicted oxidoreductase
VTSDGHKSASAAERISTATLGRGGPKITRIGLGGWAIGGPYEFGWGPVDDAVSVEAILHGVDRGIDWIDTAPAYGCGHSEEVIGTALRCLDASERPLIFTKCGRIWYSEVPGKVVSDLRPSSIRHECEESLRRLGVEAIDLYQIHRPDKQTGTPIEDSWATLASLVDEGKVRWIGVSNFDATLLDRCEAIRHVDSLQPPLNLFERDALPLLDWCRRSGTGVIAYAPMASGMLTGAFDRQRMESLADDDWRKRSSKFAEPELSRKLGVVDGLQPIAQELGCSLAALAIAWVLHQPTVTAAIVGARLPGQVDDWVGAADVVLTDEILRRIDSVALYPTIR